MFEYFADSNDGLIDLRRACEVSWTSLYNVGFATMPNEYFPAQFEVLQSGTCSACAMLPHQVSSEGGVRDEAERIKDAYRPHMQGVDTCYADRVKEKVKATKVVGSSQVTSEIDVGKGLRTTIDDMNVTELVTAARLIFGAQQSAKL
jgi:hypothetical protein